MINEVSQAGNWTRAIALKTPDPSPKTKWKQLNIIEFQVVFSNFSPIKQFICTHQTANLIRPKSKFDKYGKFPVNIFKTKLQHFYESLKISWFSFLVIPWRKARRLEQFTNTFEVTHNFVDRKSDFFYLAKNETIVHICFSTDIRKINENETMTLRSCIWNTNLLIWSHTKDQCRRLYVNRTVVQPFKNFVYKLQRKSYSLIS